MPRRCCLGCIPSRGVLHAFPHPDKFPEQLKAWVRVVSGQDDCDLDYKRMKICDRHFTERDRNRNNRLNALAVPSLFLHEHLSSRECSEPSVSTSSMALNQPEVPGNDQSSLDNLEQKPCLPLSSSISELDQTHAFNIEESFSGEMEASKRHATAAQVAALVDFMHEHSDLAKGLQNSGLERENLEARWQDLTATLNSMGGSVKSVEKWKQTWRDLKSNTKKRALRQQQSVADISGDLEGSGDTSQNIDSDSYVPPQKRFASFDEEIIKIEKDKLEIEKEYKIQKIAVLSRIASALEEIAKKQ